MLFTHIGRCLFSIIFDSKTETTKQRELSSGWYSCPHLPLSFLVIVLIVHTQYGEYH